MGLFKELVLLPLAPVRGTIAVADLVRQEAEHQFYDTDVIRRELEEVDRLRTLGEVSPDEARAIEAELLERLWIGRQRLGR
jgi:hypothetical protein